MDGFASLPRVGALFAEDFDLPETTPEPEAVDPVFSPGEVAAARETAWRDGYAAGLQKAAESDVAATRQAIAAIAEQLAAERDAAAIRADQSAEAIARLLIDSLAVAFPAICAQIRRCRGARRRPYRASGTAGGTGNYRPCASAHHHGTGAGDCTIGSGSHCACSDCRMRRDAAGRRANCMAQWQRHA
jgi:hypothetical protein